MGLNLESLFVHALDRAQVMERAREILAQSRDDASSPPGWAAPATRPKHIASRRKLAVSTVVQHWLELVTSDEVIEPHFALELSRQLGTDVFAVQIYETVGAAGHTLCRAGRVVSSEWDEQARDPFGSVRAALDQLSIPLSVVSFAEAARGKNRGWLLAPVLQHGAA